LIETGDSKRFNLLEFLLAQRKIRYNEFDLHRIIIKESTEVETNYPELLPKNVRLVTFSHGLLPLIVIAKSPVIKECEQMFGISYWGNLLLWKLLVGKEIVDVYKDAMGDHYEMFVDSLELVSEPLVFIDSSIPL
jgi:hypothetical protein